MHNDLDILMVSFRREEVLQYTLDNIATRITPSGVFKNINLFISVNAATKKSFDVIESFQDELPSAIDRFSPTYYSGNHGKAFCLNRMYDMYCKTSSHILVLDQDMAFSGDFIKHIDEASQYNADIIGFAGTKMWGHIPLREDALYKDKGTHRIYYARLIAGGMMLLPNRFLAEHKWTNLDGIYGGDDFSMCAETDKKLVYYSDTDWIRHDPIGRTIPDLKRYYEVKDKYTEQEQYVLPKGWDDEI